MRRVRVDWYHDNREFHIVDDRTGECLYKSGIRQNDMEAYTLLSSVCMEEGWRTLWDEVFGAK